jgi:hypothetical protein
VNVNVLKILKKDVLTSVALNNRGKTCVASIILKIADHLDCHLISWAFIETKIGSFHLSSSFTSMAPPLRLSVEILFHPTNPFEDLCWDHGFPKGHYHVMNLLTQFI